MYAKLLKRVFDFLLSFAILIVLLPLIFVQERPGKNEKIFKLIKFRTMTCEKDKNGNLLPDEKRLTYYGQFLRKTSLDELPELINIMVGDMSFVGPRPLLVQYLPLYNDRQRKRHTVRPGLTGLAQINGRNGISFEERFEFDIEYIQNISFKNDFLIFLGTVKTVFKSEGISSDTSKTMELFRGDTNHE